MYLVTGATGHVGSELVEQLLAKGKKVRAFTRERAKTSRWGDRIEVATGDFTRPETLREAAAGVDGVFLMNGASASKRFREVVLAIKEAGAPRLVFLSSVAAGSPALAIGRLHAKQEAAIAEVGIPTVVLRAGGFMTNSFQWISTIKSDGVVYNPMGSGQSALIAPEDIAAVAAKVLLEPKPSEAILELTGGELSTVSEQVQTLSELMGRQIRCVEVPTEVAVQGLIRSGLPPAMAEAVGQSLQAVRDGRATYKTDTVERVLGRPPMTVQEWFRRNIRMFQ